MKFRPLVAAIAAGSLLLGNVSAFAQAEEAQRRAQEQQEARDRGHYLPGDPQRYGTVDTRSRGYDRSYHRDPRQDNRYDPRANQRYEPRYDPRYYQRWDRDQRRYVPGDHWGGDWRGRGAGPEHNWYRGSTLPREYRGYHYVVNDWRGHHLYAPPSGYQWVQAPGGDYLLVAIATGLIASILLNQ